MALPDLAPKCDRIGLDLDWIEAKRVGCGAKLIEIGPDVFALLTKAELPQF